MPGTVSAAPNVPPRPSQFTNVPAFSAIAATGNTTSARSVTELARSSMLTTNGVVSSARSAPAGSGRSAASTPATISAPSSPCSAAASIAAVLRPGVVGSVALAQTRATSARAFGSPTQRPIGSSPGSAPASTAPRSPARLGIQASFAPVASASRTAAASAPGTSASRSPTRITAPGALSRSPARLKSASQEPPAASAVSAAGSAPGTVGSSVPDTLASPGEASAAIENTGRPRLRAALCSRRNTMGDSSSGSNPASSFARRSSLRRPWAPPGPFRCAWAKNKATPALAQPTATRDSPLLARLAKLQVPPARARQGSSNVLNSSRLGWLIPPAGVA